MLLGQIVYMAGQKHLIEVGNLLKDTANLEDKAKYDQPLTHIEKDRIKVLLLSFLIVIVFWGAFEQAGGLMNLYAKQKTDRMLLGIEVPASWFQSLNSFFIITLAVGVGAFWMRMKLKGKEASSLYKIAIGIVIMGWGFLFMRFAAMDYELLGKSAMYWLVLAYLFHTI